MASRAAVRAAAEIGGDDATIWMATRSLYRSDIPTGVDSETSAGGVVLDEEGDMPKIAVIHRTKQDDWSLPKGKPEADEEAEQTAVREVLEETGISAEPTRELNPSVNDEKIVRYFLMRPNEMDAFQPNEEVDELRWVEPAEAMKLLTHEQDRRIVEQIIPSEG